MDYKIKVCCSTEEILDRLAYWNVVFDIFGSGYDKEIVFYNTEESIFEDIREDFADVFYGDSDLSLAATLVETLYSKGLSIGIAESLTGGMISSAIVDVSGASDVFIESIVAYSNSSKIDRLNVDEDTILSFGAVSKETAIEMANGILNDRIAIGVSSTGIAGPGGGTDKKPVGLCYIAVVSENKTEVFEYVFSGDRNEIRNAAKDVAIFKALSHVLDNY